MQEQLSRRGMIKGAAAVVVGWSAANATFVTAVGATPADMSSVPTLDGVLETSGPVLDAFGVDFGGMIDATPRAVLRPGSVNDIVRIVRFAKRNGLQVAMNGQSGTGDDVESHSSYGQASVPGGIAIDAKSLSTIHEIGADYARVDAGVTWAQLLQATLPLGLRPAALTDYLELSIGGTISVGGIGGQIHSDGLTSDIVTDVRVVTGEGRLRHASETHRRALFRGVLAGAGQLAIIVEARVRLVPAAPMTRAFNLFYDDRAQFRADQEALALDGRFDHLEGEIVRKLDNSGWRFRIGAASYYAPGAEPDNDALLAGLQDIRDDLELLDLPYPQWAFRLAPFEAFLKDAGFWGEKKPWVGVVLTDDTIDPVLDHLLAELTPEDLGAGIAGLTTFPRSSVQRPMFATPSGPGEMLWVVDLRRFPFPGTPDAEIDRMLDQNRRLYDLAVSYGGKRYLVGAVPDMNRRDWRRHFGARWRRLRQLKADFDPWHVLTPGQGIF